MTFVILIGMFVVFLGLAILYDEGRGGSATFQYKSTNTTGEPWFILVVIGILLMVLDVYVISGFIQGYEQFMELF